MSLRETVFAMLDGFPENEAETEALNLFVDISSRFGWAGAFLTRSDVDAELGRPITDEEWNYVRHTKAWNRIGIRWTEMFMSDDINFALQCAEVGESKNVF